MVELATYMAAFWNGVDLRFRQLKDLHVRLNIAGLVVNTVKIKVFFTLAFFKFFAMLQKKFVENLSTTLNSISLINDNYF